MRRNCKELFIKNRLRNKVKTGRFFMPKLIKNKAEISTGYYYSPLF